MQQFFQNLILNLPISIFFQCYYYYFFHFLGLFPFLFLTKKNVLFCYSWNFQPIRYWVQISRLLHGFPLEHPEKGFSSSKDAIEVQTEKKWLSMDFEPFDIFLGFARTKLPFHDVPFPEKQAINSLRPVFQKH